MPRVVSVISDRAEAAGLLAARDLGAATATVLREPGTSAAVFERELTASIDASQPQVIALAGFMRILSTPFVEHYLGRMLNIHPSLLPAYRGLHTHRRVLEAGCRRTRRQRALRHARA